MDKLAQKPVVFPRKVVAPVKAKRRSTAAAVQMTNHAQMDDLFASAAGKRAALIMTGAKRGLPDGPFLVVRRLTVHLERFHNFQSSAVHFVFMVMSGRETDADMNVLADMGSEFLIKTADDEYQIEKTVSKSILSSTMFWSPKFNRETVQRFALASLPNLENIYVKDVALEADH